MDERGDKRFGTTRLDDADPLTLVDRGEDVDDDEAVTSADTDTEHEKPNPKSNTKTKKTRR